MKKKTKRKIIQNDIKEYIKNTKRHITEEEWLEVLLYSNDEIADKIIADKEKPTMLRRMMTWIRTGADDGNESNKNYQITIETLRILNRLTTINDNRKKTRTQNIEQIIKQREIKARTKYIEAQTNKLLENEGHNVDPIINGFF